jgi:hypothetical protein
MKIRKQQGLSIIGFLMVLSLVIFATFMGLRIGPIYLEYFSVKNAMDGVAKERGSAQYTPFDIRMKVLDRLFISYSAENVLDEQMSWHILTGRCSCRTDHR